MWVVCPPGAILLLFIMTLFLLFMVQYYGDIIRPLVTQPDVYKRQEQPWSNQTCSLYSCIIPWVHEWIVFYEIFLITGEWEHPEVLHSYK